MLINPSLHNCLENTIFDFQITTDTIHPVQISSSDNCITRVKVNGRNDSGRPRFDGSLWYWPYISSLMIKSDDVSQQCKYVPYADDLTGGGRLRELKKWFCNVVFYRPQFGYDAEPSKSWLVGKDSLYDEALEIFKDTAVKVTKKGKKHLGAAIGHTDFCKEFVSAIVKDWVAEIEALSTLLLSYRLRTHHLLR